MHALELRHFGQVVVVREQAGLHRLRKEDQFGLQFPGLGITFMQPQIEALDLPGSTYKPFMALAALESGKRAASTKIYRHPENPTLTWSGRGRKPSWFAAHVDAGKNPDDLLG